VLDEGQENQDAKSMLGELVQSHENVIRDMREIITQLEETRDYATNDMLIKFLGGHEQKVWMLRSHLQHKPQE
jgi:DNA-binding ferritin-like protein